MNIPTTKKVGEKNKNLEEDGGGDNLSNRSNYSNSFEEIDEKMSIFAESIMTDFQSVDSLDFGHSPNSYVKNKTPKDWKYLITKVAKHGT